MCTSFVGAWLGGGEMKSVFVVLLVVAVSSQGLADTVTLKDGTVITGKVIQSNEKTLTVEISTDAISKVEYGEKEGTGATEPTSIRRTAVMWNPVPTLFLMAVGYGIFDIELEAEIAATGWLTIFSCVDVASSTGELACNLRIGPKFRPGAHYLRGFFLGIYPGVFFVPSYPSSLAYDVTADVGYEWVLGSGLLLGLDAGVTYLNGGGYPMILYGPGFHLGYAF